MLPHHSDTDVRDSYEFHELSTSGDLHSYVHTCGGSIHHVEAAVIMRQIFKAVEHLHAHSITHCDLKLENILMTSLTPGARIIVTDFDLCHHESELETAPKQFTLAEDNKPVGTPGYIAPEIYHAIADSRKYVRYSPTIDLWAVGIIAAVFLTGKMPFGSTDAFKICTSSAAAAYFERYEQLSGPRVVQGPTWATVPDRPKDLVQRLLVMSEKERLTAKQALQHGWFTHEGLAQKHEAIWWWASKHAMRPRKPNADFVQEIDPSIHQRAIRSQCPQVSATIPAPALFEPPPTPTRGFSPLKRKRVEPAPISIANDASCASTNATASDISQAFSEVSQLQRPAGLEEKGSKQLGGLEDSRPMPASSLMQAGFDSCLRSTNALDTFIGIGLSILEPECHHTPKGIGDEASQSLQLGLNTVLTSQNRIAPLDSHPMQDTISSAHPTQVPPSISNHLNPAYVFTSNALKDGLINKISRANPWKASQSPTITLANDAHVEGPSEAVRESSLGGSSLHVKQASDTTTQRVPDTPSMSQMSTQLPSAQARSQSQGSQPPSTIVRASSLLPTDTLPSQSEQAVSHLTARMGAQGSTNHGKKRGVDGCSG